MVPAKQYKASTRINASAEVVWAILVDVSSWSHWDTNFNAVEGRIVLGERLRIFSKVMRGRVVSVIVTELVPYRKMTLTSRIPAGLFTVKHSYSLESNNGAVEFTSYEYFTGLLAPLLVRSIPDMTKSFDEFVSRLKDQAEGSPEPPSAQLGRG